MGSIDIKGYQSQLAQQQTALNSYIGTNIAAISLPATGKDVKEGASNFLTKSGWVYNIIGIIAFIVGLIVGSTGIWITGCAAITSGCYCIFKGKQQLKSEAYETVGNSLLGSIEKVIAYVSESWTKFVMSQNDSLRTDIVKSDLTDTQKVKALTHFTDASALKVDLPELISEVTTLDGDENIAVMKAYLPKATAEIKQSLHLASKAQGDIYTLVERESAE